MFHYTKAVLRNIKSIGLFKRYRDGKQRDANESDKLFRRLIRMILAVPLLPKSQASLAWSNYLKGKLEEYQDETIGKFIRYFERQWISLQQQLWNFYFMDHRTTNAAEGFHSVLKR